MFCTGEVGSGKTTLVAKLQGVEEYMKGRGLEYLYFSVHDDDIDGNRRAAALSWPSKSPASVLHVDNDDNDNTKK